MRHCLCRGRIGIAHAWKTAGRYGKPFSAPIRPHLSRPQHAACPKSPPANPYRRPRPFRQFAAVPRKCRAVVTKMISHRNIARRYALLHRAGERPQHKQTDTKILRFIRPGYNVIRTRLIAVNQIAQPKQQNARQLIMFSVITHSFPPKTPCQKPRPCNYTHRRRIAPPVSHYNPARFNPFEESP